ncbi:MAG: hypothetical protein WAK11_07910 [Candidatus Cybelea sp.]
MGPRGFWIALAIVLFYLIALPRIGTVWYVTIPEPPPRLATSSPPAGFVPNMPPTRAFREKGDCLAAAERFSQDADCVPRNTLLWGW